MMVAEERTSRPPASPPPPATSPKLLLSAPRARLPLIVLWRIVTLWAEMPPPAPRPTADVPPSAWLAVIVQPVMVRVPPRLRRPPPNARVLALAKATLWERTSPDR